jgi:hypothetical protein
LDPDIVFSSKACGKVARAASILARAPQIDRLVHAQSAAHALFYPCAVRRMSALLYAGGARLKGVVARRQDGAIAHLTLLAGR